MMALLGAHSLYCERQAATTVTEAPSLVCSSLGWRRSRLGVGQGQAGCPPQLPLCTPQSQMHQQLPMGYGGAVKWGRAGRGAPPHPVWGLCQGAPLPLPAQSRARRRRPRGPARPAAPGSQREWLAELSQPAGQRTLGRSHSPLGLANRGNKAAFVA